MYSNSEKSVVVVIVCIVFQISITIAIKLTRMTHNIDFGPEVKSDSYLIYDQSNFANPSLVYGVCNVNTTLSDIFICKMFMESNKAVGSPEHVRSCNVTVKRIRAGHSVYRSVVALDEDTAVMIPHEYNASSLTFVHFADCRQRIVDLDYDLSSAKVLAPLDNIFDLIRVEGDTKCFSDCRLIMDFDGNVILKAHRWLRNYHNEYTAMQSPTKGRLLVSTPSVFLEPALQISAVNDTSDVEMLKVYPADYDPSLGYKMTASVAHQLLTACTAVNLTITCGQFDFNGALTFETNLTLIEFAHLHSMKVFNLPEGGLLLLYTECLRHDSQSNEDNCQYSQKNVFLTKIDVSGKRIGTLEITNFSGNNVLKRIHFFVNEENSLCLSQPYFTDEFKKNGQLTLDIVCFEHEEFLS